jgi:hypothetical protein
VRWCMWVMHGELVHGQTDRVNVLTLVPWVSMFHSAAECSERVECGKKRSSHYGRVPKDVEQDRNRDQVELPPGDFDADVDRVCLGLMLVERLFSFAATGV